jgi:hypothetical protein
VKKSCSFVTFYNAFLRAAVQYRFCNTAEERKAVFTAPSKLPNFLTKYCQSSEEQNQEGIQKECERLKPIHVSSWAAFRSDKQPP